MEIVKINFENCFGIKKFRETLDFRRHKCVLIYAPNGTMKTSFHARELFELYKGVSTDHTGLIEEVNMMTPEGIHLNTFMYEPLIDMAVTHLVNLYNRCNEELI